FSDESVGEAERGLDRLYGTLGAVLERSDPPGETVADEVLRKQDAELLEATATLPELFREAMDNDFNTAQAIGHLFGVQRHLQRFLDRFGRKKLKGPAAGLARRAGEALREHAQIFGILQRDPEVFLREQRSLKIRSTGMTEEEVEGLIRRRQQARQEKNFEEGDRIRAQLEQKKIQLEDTPGGTRWRVLL
ncbi:MAG TPA: cysteine--tRNA ligase, partial [Syntrophobacteraceae bacterium]|nr:cysteine--tRNA ligase [Syntrophobacteraceae bacterium]